jgi:hypothetical protein
MKRLRVIDESGNKQDYDTEFVPRIGERIELEYGRSGQPVTTHFHRVKDVAYRLDKPADVQAYILIEEEVAGEDWPT